MFAHLPTPDGRAIITLVVKDTLRRLLWASWLLCGLIVATSLDSMPDPPAIQQRSVQSQCPDQPLERATDPEQRTVLCSPVQEPHSLWPVVQAFTDARPSVEAPLMRDAADSSPPFPC